MPAGKSLHISLGLLWSHCDGLLAPLHLLDDVVKMSDVVLKDQLSADVDGVVEIREEVGEYEWGHVAHDDLAELFSNVHGGTNFIRRLVDDVRQGNDVGSEVAVGGLVDHLDDGVDVLNAVLVGDDVERDGHGAVDQDPFQGLDVSVIEMCDLKSESFGNFLRLVSS